MQQYIQNDILFSLKSLEKNEQKEPQCPLSPLGTAKSVEKLIVANQNNLNNYDNYNEFLPQEDSQKQFYIGAQKRQQIFSKKNKVDKPNNLYSDTNLASMQNIEPSFSFVQSQKQIKSNQQSLNGSNHNINHELQSPIGGNNNSQKKIGDQLANSYFKQLEIEMKEEQNSSLFNSSELKFNRFKKPSTEEFQNSKLHQSNLTGSMSMCKNQINDILVSIDSPDQIIEKPEKRNIYKQMRIMNYVKVYINKMKSLSLFSNYDLMRRQHFELIKDSTCYLYDIAFQSTLQQKNQPLYKFKLLMSKLSKCFKLIPLINPENQWCIIWDIIFGISLLFYFFIIPIEISFKIFFDFYHNYLITIFICNILLQFSKGFYQKGSLVMDQKQIVINYLKNYFIIDIIIIINISSHFQTWLCYLKYQQLREIIQRSDDHFQIIRRFPIIYELSHLIITIALIGQIAGCGFHLIAEKEIEANQEAKTWLNTMHLNEQDWAERYIASIYFAYITMITVGFGDIYPVTQNERLYVIIMTLCSSAIFGYVMNTIGSIFQSQAQKTASFKKRKQDITNFLNFRNINRQLQIKVLKYIDYQGRTQKNNDLNQDILFKDIPSNLIEEVCQQYYGRYLQQNKIMKLNFSIESIMALSVKMKEFYLAPNQYLFKQGTRVQCVYFLIEGELDYIWERKEQNQEGISFSTLNQAGEALGMRCAFTGKEIKYSIRSTKNTGSKLIYFYIEDFISVLQTFPKDFEKFCELRDEIQFNKYSLDTKCQSCNRFNHIFEECPLINMKSRYSQFIVARYTYPFKQERKKLKRKTSKFNTLKKKDLIIDCVAQIKIHMFIDNYPEFAQNSNYLYDLDINTLFGQIPPFIYVDGQYIPDEEQNGDNPEIDQNFFTQKSDSYKGDIFQKQIKRKSNGVLEDQIPSSSFVQVNQPQQIQYQNNLNENEESLTSLQIPSQSQIIDQTNIQQQQIKNNSKLHPQFGNDQMTIRQRKHSGSSIQNSDISINQIDNFGGYSKEQNMNQINLPSFTENNKNQIITSQYKRSETTSIKQKQNTQKNSKIIVQNQQNNQNIGILYSNVQYLTEKDGRKPTLKKNTTIVYDNQDVKLNSQTNQMNKKYDIVFEDFDKMKNYIKYYPRYNCKNILERYNFIQKRIISKPRKSHQSRQHAIYGINYKKQSLNNVFPRQSQFLLANKLQQK